MKLDKFAFAIPVAAIMAMLSSPALANSSEKHGSEKHRKNHAAVFIGGTHVPEADHTGFTLGIDLEHEITKRFGVGLVVEHAFQAVDATSVFGVVDIHLGHGFLVQVGPGVEWVDGEAFAAGRFGLFYEIHVGDFIVSPSISYDISGAEDSIVFGTGFGTKF